MKREESTGTTSSPSDQMHTAITGTHIAIIFLRYDHDMLHVTVRTVYAHARNGHVPKRPFTNCYVDGHFLNSTKTQGLIRVGRQGG